MVDALLCFNVCVAVVDALLCFNGGSHSCLSSGGEPRYDLRMYLSFGTSSLSSSSSSLSSLALSPPYYCYSCFVSRMRYLFFLVSRSSCGELRFVGIIQNIIFTIIIVIFIVVISIVTSMLLLLLLCLKHALAVFLVSLFFL